MARLFWMGARIEVYIFFIILAVCLFVCLFFRGHLATPSYNSEGMEAMRNMGDINKENWGDTYSKLVAMVSGVRNPSTSGQQ